MSTTRKIYAFFDTNFLVQCRDLNQINFADLIGAFDELELLLSEPVIKEIDKFKTDSNRRRSSQARKYNSLFRKMHSNHNNSYQVSEKPSVTIRFSPFYSCDQLAKLDASLNVENADDRLIASTQMFVKHNNTADVRIIANDTVVLIKAQQRNIVNHPVPDDWLLQPENDPNAKKVIELQDENNRLRASLPEFNISSKLFNPEGIATDKVRFKEIENVDSQQVEVFLGMIQKAFPMKTDYSDEDEKFEVFKRSFLKRMINVDYTKPSIEAIRRYSDERYPNWIEKTNNWIQTIGAHLHKKLNTYSIEVHLLNKGSTFAHNVLAEFTILNDCLFIPSGLIEDDALLIPKMPKPPSPPKGRNPFEIVFNQGGMIRLPPIPSLYPPRKPEHNKYSFYYVKKPTDYYTSVQFNCDEFRHDIEAEIFTFYFTVPKQYNLTEVKLSCTVSCENLPKPSQTIITYPVETIDNDFFDVVESTILKEIGLLKEGMGL
ncbi:MAG: PIN domain-containing protein [Candidatus Cloacimonetes bacterium]|jgi:hypothetical protein|nr:PIN domain-containing protein [Candidatus Cloacimonadota bacterium]